MNKPLRFLKNLPNTLKELRISLDKDKYTSFNLYFQDESRFGLKTNIGRCLTARGVKPVIKYQHAFKNTYLYGSFSPIDGDSFVTEIEGTTSEIFYNYLVDFSTHRPDEFKIIVIDNAGFHSLKKYDIPDNIALIRIPPYSPELNSSEKIWAFVKQSFKNRVFETLDNVKSWLHKFIEDNMSCSIVKSITHHEVFNQAFTTHFEI